MLRRYHDKTESATFAILPAIDLVAGRVVRLEQGDFTRETAYGDDPVAVARVFAGDGATLLHVVDLDGARAGEPRQLPVVAEIAAAAVPAVVEAAGGIRSDAAVDAAVRAGAGRVVLGTAALADPAFAARTVERIGAEAVAVAVDVRDGLAVGDGWREGAAGRPAIDAVERLADAGVRTFEVTAIARDGLLEGPDLELLAEIVRLGRGEVIASGGIGRVEDLVAVRDLGCAGAIVGRALYEGRFTLRQAVEAIRA